MTTEKQQEHGNMNYDLMAKYLSGECTEDEKIKTENLIHDNSEYESLMKSMSMLWQTEELENEPANVEKLWNKVYVKAGISEEIEITRDTLIKMRSFKAIRFPFRLKPAYYRAFAYAAIILFVVALPFLLTDITEVLRWGYGNSELKTLKVARMEQSRINLADGTLITLDAGSILRYPEEFTAITREVYLEGEGYFEVTSDRSRSFIVHANYAQVEVLGTKFNIRAWKSNSRVDVTVTEGKVSLEREKGKTPGEGVLITAGEISSIPERSKPSKPREVNVQDRLGWMRFEMNFENEPLSEVLNQLERWYNLTFDYSDPTILDEHVTIHIKKRSVDEVLEIIGTITETTVSRNGKKVSIRVINSKKE